MSKFILALAFAAVVALGVATPSFVATNRTKYHVSNVTLEFTQAFAQCKRNGWTLATERTPEATQEINDALVAAGNTTHVHFLGGFQQKGGDFYPAWIWLEDGKDFDYTNWLGGNVSTTYECLVKFPLKTYSGQWTSGNCATPSYFVCESESD